MKEYVTRSEFTCKCGCGANNIYPRLVKMLNEARISAKTPFIINSGVRCPAHNKIIGGSPSSSHITGLAADIAYNGSHQRHLILKALYAQGFERVGINKHKKFIHVDVDTSKPQELTWMY